MKNAIAAALSSLLMMTGPATAFDSQGHRGARGLAPENSIPGWKKALEIGVDTIECDLAVTKDDVVGSATDHPARISEFTFEQLQQYVVGRLKPGPVGDPVDSEHAGDDGQTASNGR